MSESVPVRVVSEVCVVSVARHARVLQLMTTYYSCFDAAKIKGKTGKERQNVTLLLIFFAHHKNQ